jgi:hypothetical protein
MTHSDVGCFNATGQLFAPACQGKAKIIIRWWPFSSFKHFFSPHDLALCEECMATLKKDFPDGVMMVIGTPLLVE